MEGIIRERFAVKKSVEGIIREEKSIIRDAVDIFLLSAISTKRELSH